MPWCNSPHTALMTPSLHIIIELMEDNPSGLVKGSLDMALGDLLHGIFFEGISMVDGEGQIVSSIFLCCKGCFRKLTCLSFFL
jgi:hypothetical protein